MIYLLIPAHNEAENLPRLFETWRKVSADLKQPLRFMIIDDASSDDTASLSRAAGSDVEVHSLNPNQGPGGAFIFGFNLLLPRLNGDDLVFTVEADNTSDAGIAKEMIEAYNDGTDLVLAACYADGGAVLGTTPVRVFLSSSANLLLMTAFRFPNVTTFTSFYRLWRPALLKCLAGEKGIVIRLHGFVCMAELLLLSFLSGARVREVPMVLEGFQRQGQSNMKIMKTIFEYFRFFVLRAPDFFRLWIRSAKQ